MNNAAMHIGICPEVEMLDQSLIFKGFGFLHFCNLCFVVNIVFCDNHTYGYDNTVVIDHCSIMSIPKNLLIVSKTPKKPPFFTS